MSVDVSAASNLPPRADEFFRIFARFEFALKMVGYATMSGKMVKIRWDCFARSGPIGEQFFVEAQESHEYPLLFTDPPKADRIVDGQYGFQEYAQAPETVDDLFILVRRVRNNLFHGGKYFDDESDRNERLVAEAIKLLLLACERHPDINFIFEGRA